MASRLLPDIALAEWMDILIRAVGLPLTPQRLGRLRLNRLRQAGRGALKPVDDDTLRQVIALLRGQGVDMRQSVPSPQPY
ncbi:dinitrogenase iron-molybdenum cofactor N-terminal domain-containing protein, partial [Wenyingzhuangia sp. 1_MG-2023]|nr:dinitrogenase iron-molybdenum cofactor N-terminal domain-containing protein [Wenyingzhuangia sp. 1_MG-2023]